MQSRPVLEETLHFYTRNVDRQEFRLAPNPERNELIRYIFAVKARQHDIGVIALVVMSTHVHAVLLDPMGVLPLFTEGLNSMLARVLNWFDGRSGRLWDGKQPSQITLRSNEVVLDKIAYAIANPVAAGAVSRGRDYPGICVSFPARARVAKRPAFFDPSVFEASIRQRRGKRAAVSVSQVRAMESDWDKAGTRWPAYVVFEVCRPPGFDDLGDQELGRLIARTIRAKEAKAREDRASNGLPKALGAERCSGLPISLRADRHRLFTMTPRFVAEGIAARREEQAALAVWAAAYAPALARWRSGDRLVEFPAGTYYMRVRHSVVIERAPPR